MKTLGGLEWHKRFNEHMGCIKGCLDYLEIAAHCVHPVEPASDSKTVQDALTTVLDRVERPDAWDWTTTFASPEGAQLVRESAEAERKGVASLKEIAKAL